MIRMFKSHITLSLGLLVSSILCGQTTLYVDKDAPNTDGDGLSWSTAFKHLNDAIDYASDLFDPDSGLPIVGITICVAEGTYYPDEGANQINDEQTSRFYFPPSVSRIIGGFRGDEESLSQANPEIYVTTLSGLIYEEYGITDLGVDQLIYLNDNILEGFDLVNKSNSSGTIARGLSVSFSTSRASCTGVCSSPVSTSTSTPSCESSSAVSKTLSISAIR